MRVMIGTAGKTGPAGNDPRDGETSHWPPPSALATPPQDSLRGEIPNKVPRAHPQCGSESRHAMFGRPVAMMLTREVGDHPRKRRCYLTDTGIPRSAPRERHGLCNDNRPFTWPRDHRARTISSRRPTPRAEQIFFGEYSRSPNP
jgi:hypothetical protein